MKKMIFGALATIFAGVLSVQAQPKGFKQVELGLGKVSSYAGPCVQGGAFCSDEIQDIDRGFSTGIQITESNVAVAFSQEFYKANAQYLKEGLIVDKDFSLPRDVSEKLGVRGEVVVAGGKVYRTILSEGYYIVSMARKK